MTNKETSSKQQKKYHSDYFDHVQKNDTRQALVSRIVFTVLCIVAAAIVVFLLLT